MLVKEIMTKEVITVRRSTTLRELLDLFGKFHIFPLVPVIEEDNKLVGVVSFRNLISAFRSYDSGILKAVPFVDEEEDDIFELDLSGDVGALVVVEDIMERKFISLEQHVSLEEAYKLLKLNFKDEVPVTDTVGKLVGMVGVFDILIEVFRRKGAI